MQKNIKTYWNYNPRPLIYECQVLIKESAFTFQPLSRFEVAISNRLKVINKKHFFIRLVKTKIAKQINRVSHVAQEALSRYATSRKRSHFNAECQIDVLLKA